MYLLNEIKYNVHIECYGNYIKVENIQSHVRNSHILEIPQKDFWVSCRVILEGLGCPNDAHIIVLASRASGCLFGHPNP